MKKEGGENSVTIKGNPPWGNAISSFKNAVVGPRKCFVVGATGEVGKCLVKQILSSNAFDRVIVVTRRSLQYGGPNRDLLEEHVLEDFGKLETEYSDVFAGCQFGFCALGTTKAKAGSPEGFVKVDHDYIVQIGKMAKNNGCKWFGLVSSVGANPTSSFLYLRTKGRTEADLRSLELPRLAIFRPSYLQCQRTESRPLERVAGWFMPLLNLISGGRMAIPTDTVARAMLIEAMEAGVADAQGEPGAAIKVFDNQAMVNTVKLAGHV